MNIKLLAISHVTFKDRIWLEELVLDVLALPGVPGDGGDVLHHQLPRLGLAGAALPREDDGLVLSPVPQMMPRPVSQRVAATQDIYPESDTLDTHIWGGIWWRQWFLYLSITSGV